MVEMRTQLAIERAGLVTLHLQPARRSSIPTAGKQVLVLGAGKMSELSARYLMKQEAKSVCVINRTFEHAAELAGTLGGTAAPFEARWQQMESADIVISSTSCPHTILGRDEAESIVRARNGRPLVIVDIAMLRDVDGEVPGIFLYDLDDLEKSRTVQRGRARSRRSGCADDRGRGGLRLSTQTPCGARGAHDRCPAHSSG